VTVRPLTFVGTVRVLDADSVSVIALTELAFNAALTLSVIVFATLFVRTCLDADPDSVSVTAFTELALSACDPPAPADADTVHC